MSIPMARPAAQNAPGEIEAAVVRVLRSGRYIGGPEVLGFESELAAHVGASHAIGTSSGSTALHAVLLALDIGPGDEVILPAHTFCATLEAILHVGATPVLVDVDDDFLMDLDAMAAALSVRTSAVIGVHLFGKSFSVADAKALLSNTASILNAEHRTPSLIEDAAQAFGVRPTGTAACYSFFPAKVLGAAGDAGAVVTDDGDLAAILHACINHGRRDGVSTVLGHNFRLDALQAAILRAKLSGVPAMVARRRAIALRYLEALVGLPLSLPRDDPQHLWQCFCLELDHRDQLRHALAEASIASAVYYAPPLHRHPAFAERARFGALPRAERAAARSLCLPIYPELDDDEVDQIIDAVRGFFIR